MELKAWISGCIAAVCMMGILFGGPISCSIWSQDFATRRVIAVCQGDLKTDPGRAAACAMVIEDARHAGK